MQFLIDPNTELTLNKISEIIMQFETGDKIRLKRYKDYYDGKQDIMRKVAANDYKPCNRIVTNYCYNITTNYQGYITGVDIAYSSDEDIEAVQRVLNYNDVAAEDSELLLNALIYGRSFEVVYIDENKQQRFKVIDSLECIPIYDNTLNQELLYVIRYYRVDNTDATKGYYIEVYNKNTVDRYTTDMAYSGIQFVDSTPHYYKQVPITVFSLNKEEVSIFNQIMTLQDAYNNLLSSEVDDFQAFCDAYLVLKGCTADDDDIKTMRENRVLLLEADASAEYLNKSISDTQIENMLKNINDQIHKIAASPDFSQESFGTSSGIALRFRLLGFENAASAIEKNMSKALQRRIELICEILSLTSESGEDMWRDIEIIFKRNIPEDNMEAANMVNILRGIVSDKTLISQLPFVTDAERETELLAAQTAAQMELYNFPSLAQNESEEGEEE